MHAGTSTTLARGHVSCGTTRRGSGSPSARTRSRTAAGASLGTARSSRTSSSNSRSKSTVSDAGIAHHLLESFQCAAEPRRTGGLADSQQARGAGAVELEQHTQRDHLALGGRELAQRRGECAFPPGRLRGRVEVPCVTLLAAQSPLLGPEVIERDMTRDCAEPGTRSASARIEPPPGTKRALECLAGQGLGDGAVAGPKQEIP